MQTYSFSVGTDNGVFTISVLAPDAAAARGKVSSLVYGHATIDELIPVA